MVEVDDNNAMMDSWLPPNPSSRTLFSNSSNEEFGSSSFSTLLVENGNLGLPWGSENQKVNVSTRIEGEVGINSLNDLSPQPKLFGDPRSSSFGGLAERVATRKGFNVPKLDTVNIQSISMVSSSETPSPYLTIPPGLSPTALLESPALFSDTLDQPSPTTGKYEFLENLSSIAMPVSCLAAFAKSEYNLFEDISEAFPFKTHIESDSRHSRLVKKLELPTIEGYVQMENPTGERKVEASSENFQYQPEFCIQSGYSFASDRKNTTSNAMLNQQIGDSIVVSGLQNREAGPRRELSAAYGTPDEDGYNWRKYGQKQVKGSENPRSYYKCTHPNCQMKKKVERSHEGRITEIIYKGSHNHLKPNIDCRFSVPSPNPLNELQSDGSDQPDSQASFDEKPIKGSSQSGIGCQDCLGDGLEATSAAPISAEFCDAFNALQENQDDDHPSPESIDVSSAMSNDEEDDRETHGSISLSGDGEETESRSRKLDSCVVEINAASRTIREPRVVIQTMSEIDILDDGYRWRKYGQKVVKGNPNPRSYYKCTNPGCSVRKHIERASHDLKSVITTYEGTHNHEIPTTRRSGHQNSGSSNVSSSNSATQHRNLLQKHEPIQDRFARFNNHTPLNTYNFPQKGQLGIATSFPLAMGQPSLSNLSMSGFNPIAAASMPIVPPVHSFPNHAHPTEAGYMMHKLDLKQEPLPETFLPLPNSMSVYHQMMTKPTCVVECRSEDGYSFSQV